MKNLIRGMTLILLLAAAVACGPASKLTAYQQKEADGQAVYQAEQAQAAQAAYENLHFQFQNLQQEVTEMKATFAESIPQEQIQVTIPTESLIDLPEGAKFGDSSGRATIEAQRRGDNIVLTGRCDSVARQCTLYERQTFRQQSTIDSLRRELQTKNSELSQMAFELASSNSQLAIATEETRKPPRKVGGWFAAGAVLGLAGGAGVNLLCKRFHVGTIIKCLFTKSRV